MTSTHSGRSATTSDHSGTAGGVTAFAGVLLIIGGLVQAFQGLVALFNDSFYVVGDEYLFEFDVTAWGWIHLLLGLFVAFAGFALFRGATWARIVAVTVASLSIIANFMWMPYYPIWSLTVIAFNVLVIWAVTAYSQNLLTD